MIKIDYFLSSNDDDVRLINFTLSSNSIRNDILWEIYNETSYTSGSIDNYNLETYISSPVNENKIFFIRIYMQGYSKIFFKIINLEEKETNHNIIMEIDNIEKLTEDLDLENTAKKINIITHESDGNESN